MFYIVSLKLKYNISIKTNMDSEDSEQYQMDDIQPKKKKKF